MPKEAEKKKTPHDMLRMGFRRRKLFLAGSSLVAILVMMGSHYLPEKYTGTAKFERRLGPAAEGMVGNKSESFETRKLTLQNELAGYTAVMEVAEKLGLLRGMPRTKDGTLTPEGEMQMQQLINQMRLSTRLDWEVRSDQVDLISVSYTDSRADLAQQVPNELVSRYIAWVSDQSVKSLRTSTEYLQSELDRCNRQFKEINNEKMAFEQKHAGAMPDRPGALDDQIRNLNSEIDILRRQLMLSEGRLSIIGKSTGSMTQPASGSSTDMAEATSRPLQMSMPNPERIRVEEQLRLAKEKLNQYLVFSRMKDDHPSVVGQRKIIAELEESLKSIPALTTMSGSVDDSTNAGRLELERKDAESAVQLLKNELASLEKRRKAYQDLLLNFGPVRQEYEEIIRTWETRQADMNSYEGQLQKVQMALAAEAAKKRTVLDTVLAAQPQFQPSSPSLVSILGLAVAGGLGFGAALVVLASMLDRTITTTEDAGKYLGLPIHGVIGEIVTERQRRMRRLRKWVVFPIVSTLLTVMLGVSAMSVVLRLKDPEAFNRLQQSPAGFLFSGGQSKVSVR